MKLSLTHYLIRCEREHGIDSDLRLLLETVARACKTISHAVGKGALGNVLGSANTTNIQGEAQKKLDVLSNEILFEASCWGGFLAGMASEEMDAPMGIPVAYPRGKYLLLFDPLDGSSNIDVNVSIGTIFSVLPGPSNGEERRRGRVSAARHPAGMRRLYGLRPANVAGTDCRARRAGVHARSRYRLVPADAIERANPNRHARVRDQHVQRAALGSAGQTLCRGVACRQDRPPRHGFQHAVGRLDGRRRASDHVARRHLHVSTRCARRLRSRTTAPDVRRQPDGVFDRAGRRRSHQRRINASSKSNPKNYTSVSRCFLVRPTKSSG